MLQDSIQRQYAAMSRSQQKIARYLEEHYREVAFEPVAQLASKIGTSPATVVRFCYLLGYSGYSELQKSIQLQVASAGVVTPPPAIRPPEDGQLARVAEVLMDAKHVVIVGFKESIGTAAELLHVLETARDNVLLTRLHVGDWSEVIELLGRETVLFAISFAPHYIFTHNWFMRAKNANCQTVVLTNSALSPYTGKADHLVLLDLPQRPDTYLYDISPASRYINRLMNHIYDRYGVRIKPQDLDPQFYLDLPGGQEEETQ